MKNIRIFQSLLNAKTCSRSLQLAVDLCGKYLKCHGTEIIALGQNLNIQLMQVKMVKTGVS